MARPPKLNADYWPHPAELRNDKRVKALRTKYGLTGYAVLCMLLESLAQADHFRIELNPLVLELIAGDFDLKSEQLHKIMEYLHTLGLVTKNGNTLESVQLNQWLSPLLEAREKDRARKRPQKAVFQSENGVSPPGKPPATPDSGFPGGKLQGKPGFPAENKPIDGVFRAENDVSQSENAPKESKVKKSKGNESKGKQSKNSTNGGITPGAKADFFQKESKQKAAISSEQMQQARKLFTERSPGYVWGGNDDGKLLQLLQQMQASIAQLRSELTLVDFFRRFIVGLPHYWRTQKFTVPLLAHNYNQIIGEIKPFWKKHPKPAVHTEKAKPQITAAQQQSNDREFIIAMRASYQRFLITGEMPPLVASTVYNHLAALGILHESDANLARWLKLAKERISSGVAPTNPHGNSNSLKAGLHEFTRQVAGGSPTKMLAREIALHEYFSDGRASGIAPEAHFPDLETLQSRKP